MDSHCVSSKLEGRGNQRSPEQNAPCLSSFWRWFPNFLHYLIHAPCLVFLSSRMGIFFFATCKCINKIPRTLDSACCIAYTGVVLFWLPVELVLLPFDCAAHGSGNDNVFGRAGAVGSSDTTDHCHKWVSDSSLTGNLKCMKRLLYLTFFFILMTSQWPGTLKNNNSVACTFL